MKKKYYLIIGGILLVVLLYFASNLFVEPIVKKNIAQKQINSCETEVCCYHNYNKYGDYISFSTYESCIAKFKEEIIENGIVRMTYDIPNMLDAETQEAYGVNVTRLSYNKVDSTPITIELFQMDEQIENEEASLNNYLDSILNMFSSLVGGDITEEATFTNFTSKNYESYRIFSRELILFDDSRIGVFMIQDKDSTNFLQGYYFILSEYDTQGTQYLNEIYESVEISRE